MFAPDVEARFKRIEDAHIVAAELLDRFEKETNERFGHLEAIQNAMARWMDKMADGQAEHEARMAEHEARMAEHETRMAEHEARMADLDVKIAALVDAQMETEKALGELSKTVDRYLRSRSNGGTA